jgi:hypothetical protein
MLPFVAGLATPKSPQETSRNPICFRHPTGSMSECIPDRLPRQASQGEVRLFSILSKLPDDCVVYYEPIVENRFADFIVLIPSHGVMVIEVKGWRPSDILGGDLENVTVMNRGFETRERHPIRQAREYMISLMHTCQKHKAFKKLIHADGKNKGHFTFPFGYFSILSNVTRSQVEESGKSIIFPPEKVMTRDELLAWEAEAPDVSLRRLQSYFDPWWSITPFTPNQIDTLRAIIHPEVILFSFMDSTKGLGDESIKVLDVRQENHARNMGNGHRIIYGVPGSGKTVILVARAKLIALADQTKKHLFLCYNVALALHLRHLLKDHGNIVVRHFDRLSWDLGVGRQDGEDNDSLGQRLLDTLKARNGQGDKYSSVFIDEAQDFAESWFRCALEVMEDPLDGDLLIVGDGNQGLYRHRDFTWASVGIQAVGRTINTKFDLDRCYRSTKEVMALAQAFATGGPEQAEEAIASMQVDPECCTRSSGFKPVVIGCKSLEEECHYTAALVNELLTGKWFGRDIPNPLQPSEIGILYREAGDERKQKLLDQLEATIGKAIWVNRDKKARERIIEPGVKIQTIHSSKGLQYKAVIVLWAGQMPSTRPNDDPQTERRLMFVGLTRAEDYLTVSYASPTPFVDELAATGVADLLQG